MLGLIVSSQVSAIVLMLVSWLTRFRHLKFCAGPHRRR